MAIAPPSAPPKLLTYEEYMREEPTQDRYDIVDGVRIMANPTRSHNDILIKILFAFYEFQRVFGRGRVLLSPCDVLIRRSPLRIRQPDVSFISNERLSQLPPPTDPAPLEIPPELIVEILSPSDRWGARHQKLLDYCSVGVRECWVVHRDRVMVEVLRLNPEGYNVVQTFHAGETITSLEFPELAVAVDTIFAE